MTVATEVRAAAEKIDHKLSQAKGLTSALDQLAFNHPGLNNADPIAHSIVTLIKILDDAASELLDLQEAMWDAVAKAGKVSQTSGGCDGGSKNPEAGIS